MARRQQDTTQRGKYLKHDLKTKQLVVEKINLQVRFQIIWVSKLELSILGFVF